MTLSLWFTYCGVQIFRFQHSSVYTYKTSHIELDADGAPNAYHPNDIGLDALVNAGYPHSGWRNVLVANPKNENIPFIQLDGPTKGYFVSMTSLCDPHKVDTDPTKYVDATKIPYVVFPGSFYSIRGTGQLGSVGLVRNLSNGLQSGFVVADKGGIEEPLGEISLRLAENLGGKNLSARTGYGSPQGVFQYMIFPQNVILQPWPLTEDAIQTLALQQFNEISEWPSIS